MAIWESRIYISISDIATPRLLRRPQGVWGGDSESLRLLG
jgi:hypothetical protein